MSKLEDKFRERLLGHLSDANTEVDVRVAVDICKEEMLSFISFFAENDFKIFNNDLFYIETSPTMKDVYTKCELLEMYLNEEEI